MTRELNKDISQKVSVISYEEIERTDFFKKMPKFQKNFFNQNKKHVTHQIHHGFNVSRNLSFEGWARQSNTSYQVEQIVKELNENRP